ncbi:MAG TPA: helix-turn-helix transcriptional regulator [Acetobacteraceae bacterium]|nr:helix-turn-helix transcriptional regulator [Acetobacteraceae bacterium]
MISLTDVKDQLLKDPKVKAEYDRLGPVYQLVGAMVEARHDAGLTQQEVAARMGTTQSVIARLENAHHLPSLDLVTRYAAAIGRRVDIHLVAAE